MGSDHNRENSSLVYGKGILKFFFLVTLRYWAVKNPCVVLEGARFTLLTAQSLPIILSSFSCPSPPRLAAFTLLFYSLLH